MAGLEERDRFVRRAMETLNVSIFWPLGFVATAVFISTRVCPPASYTCGAVILGLIWAGVLVVHWRIRSSIGDLVALLILVIGLTFLRDVVSPEKGILSGIYGYAVAFAAGLAVLRSLHRPISRFCRLLPDDNKVQNKGSDAIQT